MKPKMFKKLKIKCVFKPLLYSGLFFSINTNAIEFQAYEKKIKTNYHVRSAVEKFSRKSIEENLRTFVAAGRPSRAFGSVGHAKTQVYLEEKLQSFNSENSSFKIMEFKPNIAQIKNSKEIINGKGKNYIWEKKGLIKPEEILILTAHYDTILRDNKTKELTLKGEMPGADSNGSGVAALLILIELLNKLDLPKTIQVVFLDAEELEAQGSTEYIQKLVIDGLKIQGFLNIIMIAHDSKKEDLDQKLNNMNLYFFKPQDESFAALIDEAGKRNISNINFRRLQLLETANLPGKNTLANLSKTGVPALMMTQSLDRDKNPRYQSSNDFIETLNISTYISTFKFLANSVLTWNYDVVK